MLIIMAYYAIFLLLFLVHQNAALKTISNEEFATFVPLHHVDPFSQCVEAAGGAYCTADFKLLADGPHELYDKMLNYSYSALRHFDYTNPRYGYCITRRCKQFYTGDSESELMEAMGSCLNHTLEQEYGLRARINFGTCYRHGEQKHQITWVDCAAALLFLSLVGLAAAGTYYDLFATNKDTKGYLMCFSITANWKILKAPWPQDKMTGRLAVFNGIRTITAIMIIIFHALIPVIPTVENPGHFEAANESHAFHFICNVHIVMQTFFFMSGMFLVYTVQINNEKNPMSWRSLPRAIFLRWLRLSLVPQFMLLYTATWFKFAPYGPNWEGLVGSEVEDCQQTWPSFVLYYNNYVVGQRCSIHHWSTAVDFHFHIIGLMILTLSPTERIRDLMLWLFAIIGMLLPAIETYNRDLNGTFVAGFKLIQNQRDVFFDPNFNYMYKRSHTNMPAFGIGMLYGLFLYKWMKKNVDTSKYKKYVYWFWLLWPLFLSIVYSNAVLIHREGLEPAPLALRMVFALFQKPAWSLLLATFTFGIICQIENVYRRVLEWPGWTPLMKLTYCTYNVNIVIALWMYGPTTQLTHASDLSLINNAAGIVVITFIVATLLWLLVEAPCNNLTRKLMHERQSIIKLQETPKKKD